MGRKSVAVLDIRSSEVSVIVGARGVNNTFVFTAIHTEEYDGYDENSFLEEAGLADAIVKCVTSVEKICGERLKELYVGVPGAFTRVVPKEQLVGFPRIRTIGQREIDMLFASGQKAPSSYRFIRATSMIYVTADDRRVVDPVGLSSTSLSGVLSYFYCSEYFAKTMGRIFSDMQIELHYLPTEYAMASYLIPSETRDEYALFLDVGFMSTSLCVLLGNGVLAQRTYFVGKGQIAVNVMQRFSISYEAALSLLSKANLFTRSSGAKMEINDRGAVYEIDMDAFIESVKEGLDGICEAISGFLEECSGKELDFKPLYVTGEGLADIRGALEHISKRVSRVCEQLAPDLPYYNKPAMSSRIALVDLAYEDNRRHGIFYKLSKKFGG